jgi:hypothetical protein
MTASAPPAADEFTPDPEPSAVADAAGYRTLLERLSHQSVAKHYAAYADIPWDDPAFALIANDSRFELSPHDPIGATTWYRGLHPAERARFGLELIASFAKIGSNFENVLQRGLLEFALRLPNGAPEYRYCLHEVIEEGQHSLMFQEFVNRSGVPASGMPRWMEIGSRAVVRSARVFPELFFLFVLGGEDPIDYVQREHLRTDQFPHPLLRRISHIHITEEARHLAFARAYLRRHVPKLGRFRKMLLSLRTPILLGQMARMMLQPTPAMIRRYGIPKTVLREAYGSDAARAQRAAALRKPRELCAELGILRPPFDRLWKRMGIC